jgi:molecular chaperone GrpE (heat shock protein)
MSEKSKPEDQNAGAKTPPAGGPEAAEDKTGGDRLDRLERVIRTIGRESLELVRGLEELKSSVAAVRGRMDEVELSVKGSSQTVWRAVQDSQSAAKAAEEHYAGALRELEARIREELVRQAMRGALNAVLPALDDLDLVLAFEGRKAEGESGPDALLKGLRLVRQKLADGLRTLGLEEIPVEPGQTAFDPSVHQVAEADVPPGLVPEMDVPRGTILFVRRAGFLFDGKLFRSPQVIVKTQKT